LSSPAKRIDKYFKLCIKFSLSEGELAKRLKFFDSVLTIPPEIAGEIIVRGVENRKPRILVGRDAKYAALVERLMPVTYWNWLGQGAKQ